MKPEQKSTAIIFVKLDSISFKDIKMSPSLSCSLNMNTNSLTFQAKLKEPISSRVSARHSDVFLKWHWPKFYLITKTQI